MTSPVGHHSGTVARFGHDPLSIRFANTRWASRGQFHDGIGTPELLHQWVTANVERPGPDAFPAPTETDVRRFTELRHAIRCLIPAAETAADAERIDRLELLNRLSATAPRWPVLVQAGERYRVVERTDRDGLDHALAILAQDAVAVLGGDLVDDVRACPGPGCVQFFVKDHSRREWCSTACGNRARAARHYHRHREG